MDGKLLGCVVMALVCCVRQVKSTKTNGTVNVFATIQDSALRRWRNRRVTPCKDSVHTLKGKNDMTAQLDVKFVTTQAGATAWCLANTDCTGYSIDTRHNQMTFSSSKPRHEDAPQSTSYVVVLRCPSHHRCNKSPCENGATCRDLSTSGPGIKCACAKSWGGWYCQRKASCLDERCGAGETCSNKTTGGFTCTSDMSTETKIAIAVGAAWAVIVLIVACVAGTYAAQAAGPRPTFYTAARDAAKSTSPSSSRWTQFLE